MLNPVLQTQGRIEFEEFIILLLHKRRAVQFEVGQRVIWLYWARAGHSNVHRISGEIVKLGKKLVQIKVQKCNSEFVKRWVSKNRLEVPKD